MVNSRKTTKASIRNTSMSTASPHSIQFDSGMEVMGTPLP